MDLPQELNQITNTELIDGVEYKYKLTKNLKQNDTTIIVCNIYQIKKPKTYSVKGIAYLNFISNYKQIYIKHGMNGGEYKIPKTKYFVDGFSEKTNTVYEFHGTIYHGDPRVCNSNDSNYLGFNYGELYQKTINRENEIKNLGYNLIIVWEYDWDKFVKSVIFFQRKWKNKKINKSCLKSNISTKYKKLINREKFKKDINKMKVDETNDENIKNFTNKIMRKYEKNEIVTKNVNKLYLSDLEIKDKILINNFENVDKKLIDNLHTLIRYVYLSEFKEITNKNFIIIKNLINNLGFNDYNDQTTIIENKNVSDVSDFLIDNFEGMNIQFGINFKNKNDFKCDCKNQMQNIKKLINSILGYVGLKLENIEIKLSKNINNKRSKNYKMRLSFKDNDFNTMLDIVDKEKIIKNIEDKIIIAMLF
jgi:hypothetical protein